MFIACADSELYAPDFRFPLLTDVIKLRISMLVCNSEKSPPSPHVYCVGYMPYAGLNMFLTAIQWKSWDKYNGVCPIVQSKMGIRKVWTDGEGMTRSFTCYFYY